MPSDLTQIKCLLTCFRHLLVQYKHFHLIKLINVAQLAFNRLWGTFYVDTSLVKCTALSRWCACRGTCILQAVGQWDLYQAKPNMRQQILQAGCDHTQPAHLKVLNSVLSRLMRYKLFCDSDIDVVIPFRIRMKLHQSPWPFSHCVSSSVTLTPVLFLICHLHLPRYSCSFNWTTRHTHLCGDS